MLEPSSVRIELVLLSADGATLGRPTVDLPTRAPHKRSAHAFVACGRPVRVNYATLDKMYRGSDKFRMSQKA
jgi:hypothetical protein